jgi:hypothetical protein
MYVQSVGIYLVHLFHNDSFTTWARALLSCWHPLWSASSNAAVVSARVARETGWGRVMSIPVRCMVVRRRVAAAVVGAMARQGFGCAFPAAR